MERGAKILVETCAGVQPGEQVVIVTDVERVSIARAIADATTLVRGEATVVVSPLRNIDNEEPIVPVAAAMLQTDVIFLPVTHALAHTAAVRTAIAEGARVVSMSAFTERMMRGGWVVRRFRKPASAV
jgi:leucyl aminopeptidase (aminopeptidase T)